VSDKFFTADLAASWVKITSIFEWSVVICLGAIYNFQHFHECTNSTVLREFLDLGCEFFKISNNVDVFLITHSIESSFYFTFRRGAGARGNSGEGQGQEKSVLFVH
jgi:hypothetical protein